MKLFIKIFIINILILPNFISCREDYSHTNQLVKSYNLERIIGKRPDSLQLSAISREVILIRLESSDSILIGRISKLALDDSLLFIFEKGEGVMQFSNSGAFLRCIGKKGNNPTEYLRPIYFELDRDNDLVLIYDDSKKEILIYDYNSNLVDIVKWGPEYFHFFIPINKNEILGYTVKPYIQFNDNYNIGIISKNEAKVILRMFRRNERYDLKSALALSIARLYYFKDTISLWQFYYDTIYRILPNKQIIPKYSFSIGNSKIPFSLTNNQEFRTQSNNYTSIRDVIETTNYFFIRLLVKKKIEHIIINKLNNDITQLGPSIMINDKNNLINFWPEGALNDSTLYMTFFPSEIRISRQYNNKLLSSLKQTTILNNPWILLVYTK